MAGPNAGSLGVAGSMNVFLAHAYSDYYKNIARSRAGRGFLATMYTVSERELCNRGHPFRHSDSVKTYLFPSFTRQHGGLQAQYQLAPYHTQHGQAK